MLLTIVPKNQDIRIISSKFIYHLSPELWSIQNLPPQLCSYMRALPLILSDTLIHPINLFFKKNSMASYEYLCNKR